MSHTMLYLVEGKDLPAMDYTGKSDPFINVLVVSSSGKGKQIFQTETIEQTLNPRWDESVRVKETYLRDESLTFRFNVYDRDAFSNDYMGHFEIPISDMKKSFSRWFPLLPKPGKKNKEASGSVLVKCVAQSDAIDTNDLHIQATQKILSGDEKGAVPLLQQASEQGNLAAQRDLAILLKEGRGHDKDPLEARRWFTKASKNGDSVSENNLGYMKQHGIGGTKNVIEAKEHYEIAAQSELPPAMYNFGYSLFCGLGAQQDLEKAREYFEKAANADYPPAMNNYAFCLQFGLGGEKSLKEAETWYCEAAAAKYPPAMVNYGQFLQFAKGKGEKKARGLYEQALELDDTNAQAWFSLALCLELGIGGEANKEQAKKAYEAAAKFGEPEGAKAVKRMQRGPQRDNIIKKRIRGKSIPPRESRSPKRERVRARNESKQEAKSEVHPPLGLPVEKKGHRRTRSMGKSVG